MIQINLLPIRARKRKENVRQLISTYLLSIFFLVAVMAYFWISQANQIQTMERHLAQLQREVSENARFEVLLKELTAKKAVVDQKRSVIQELQKDRDSIVRVLALLSIEIPPEKIWFDRFTQAGNGITLDGVALSNEAIAEFMRNLEASPYVDKTSVSLALSRQTVMSNMKLREFQITYRFFPFSSVQTLLKTNAS